MFSSQPHPSSARVAPQASLGDTIREARQESELLQFFEPEVNVVVVAGAFSPDAAHAAVHSNPAFSEVVEAANAWRVVAREIPEQMNTFVAHWSEVLAELCGCARVGVRVATLARPMCPRFHVDRVTVRLVCTLRGEGTHLVESADVDRRFLGANTPDGGEHACFLRRSDAVRVAPTGGVVFLKGELWPENQGNGAIHRSPRGLASEPRVVLTLDALE